MALEAKLNPQARTIEVSGGAGTVVAFSGPIYVKSFRWISKTASAGDDLIISNEHSPGSGKSGLIWQSVAAGADWNDQELEEKTFDDGLSVEIDSGTLIINCGDPKIH